MAARKKAQATEQALPAAPFVAEPASETYTDAPDNPYFNTIAEQIGVQRIVFRSTRFSPSLQSKDVSVSDYAFWDKVRRGQAKGLELSGLFVKPLGSKVSAWVLGQRPLISTRNKRATDAINDWWEEWHPSILRAYNESLDLGDCYLVLNGDLSLTVVPPHLVKPVVNPKNYNEFWGWQIQMAVPHPIEPSRKHIITNYYFAAYRYMTIADESGVVISREKFPNVVGRIPVLHIANRKGTDELNGRPEAEPLLNALYRYNNVLDAALEGNIRQGRPTPVISKMGNMNVVAKFWEQFGTREQQRNPLTGEIETILVIHFDPDVLMTLGGEAEFSYEAPESFTEDTQNLLELIFYLILQSSEIPEFVWGNAIGSSKASAQSQLEPFLKWIIKRRGEATAWIKELTSLVLSHMAVYDQLARNQEPILSWRPIASADGRLTLDSVIWAYNKGMFSKNVALWLLPLGIDNPDLVLADAPEVSPEEHMKLLGLNNPTGTPGGGGDGGTVNSGGAPQTNKKQENPIQPTERSMEGGDGEIVAA